jgi:hypothetical protein
MDGASSLTSVARPTEACSGLGRATLGSPATDAVFSPRYGRVLPRSRPGPVRDRARGARLKLEPRRKILAGVSLDQDGPACSTAPCAISLALARSLR